MGDQGKTLKDCIRHFAPAWFAVTMGTGSVSILFHNFPFATESLAMKVVTTVFFILNLLLFVIFNALTLARYVFFPDIWSLMLQDPVQSLYIGCYPMGASTLISIGVGLVYEQYGIGGRPFLYLLWGFWWMNVAMSFLCAALLVHVMETRHTHTLNSMTAIWLLPVVTLIVASASGGVIAPKLAEISVNQALVTLTLSTIMVAIGEGLAFMILATYLSRLIIYGIPQGPSVLSVFIPLGPLSQGGYSILLLGSGFRSILPLTHGDSEFLRSSMTGEIIDVICVCMAFALWSLATMWLLYAVLGVWEVLSRQRFPFKVPSWGLIFPNGVYANLTINLYKTLDSDFFRIWGSIYTGFTALLWTVIFIRTLTLVRGGYIFEAPCLNDVDMSRNEKKPPQETPRVEL